MVVFFFGFLCVVLCEELRREVKKLVEAIGFEPDKIRFFVVGIFCTDESSRWERLREALEDEDEDSDCGEDDGNAEVSRGVFNPYVRLTDAIFVLDVFLVLQSLEVSLR